MLAEVYGIRPWEMRRMTYPELSAISQDLEAKREAAKKR